MHLLHETGSKCHNNDNEYHLINVQIFKVFRDLTKLQKVKKHEKNASLIRQ